MTRHRFVLVCNFGGGPGCLAQEEHILCHRKFQAVTGTGEKGKWEKGD